MPITGSGEGEKSLMPFNIKALFAGTPKPGKLGTILAEVITDQKTSLVAAAETKAHLTVSESERLAARNSSSEATNTALSNYLAAYDANKAAKKALESAKTGGEPVAVSKAKLTAKLTKIKLSNTTGLAKSEFAAVNIPFVPILGE